MMAAPARPLDPERIGDHLDRLYRAARALCGSSHDAEDLVQETIERVLRRPRMLRGDDDVGYLVRALRHTYCSRRRAGDRRPVVPVDPDDLALHADAAAVDPCAAAEAGELLDAVAALPLPFREAVVAVDVAGLSYKEAAQALGTREGTIMSRLYRGRGRLAEALTC